MSTYIKTENVQCPYCKEKHPVDLMVREEISKVKNKDIRHTAYYFFCSEAGEEFETHDMYLDNESRAYETYRRLYPHKSV